MSKQAISRQNGSGFFFRPKNLPLHNTPTPRPRCRSRWHLVLHRAIYNEMAASVRVASSSHPTNRPFFCSPVWLGISKIVRNKERMKVCHHPILGDPTVDLLVASPGKLSTNDVFVYPKQPCVDGGCLVISNHFWCNDLESSGWNNH